MLGQQLSPPPQLLRLIAFLDFLQLITNRQLPDAFAGGVVDGVDQRRGVWGNRRFTNAAGTQMGKVLDDMHLHIQRRTADPGHRIIIEVALVNHTLGRGDLGFAGNGISVDHGASTCLRMPSGLT